MASGAGRWLRIVAGVALITWGWSLHERVAGIVLMVVGLVPLLAGVLNVCLLAPLIGAPFAGRDARQSDSDGSGRR
ncbi:MAG: hypothetical protein NVS4B3_24360 [Gemmatimonadaceae bacterium]